jgi:thioredoxin domain-containing protein 5/protein disulfide-isomerase
MSAWVRKAIAPGMISVNEAEFNRKLEKEEVVFLLLHSGNETPVVVSAFIIRILPFKFDTPS